MSKLLIDDKPVMVLPKLAEKIGLNEAIVLQQIHYWLVTFEESNKRDHYHNGRWWVYNTKAEWGENFPWWSESTVWRALTSLRDSELVIATPKYNKQRYDRTLWYTINYGKLRKLEEALANCQTPSSQNDKNNHAKMTSPIPETTAETTTESDAPAREKADLPSSESEVSPNVEDSAKSGADDGRGDEEDAGGSELDAYGLTGEKWHEKYGHSDGRAPPSGSEPWLQWGADSRVISRRGDVPKRFIQRIGYKIEKDLGRFLDWTDKSEVKRWVKGCAKLYRIIGEDLEVLEEAHRRLSEDGMTLASPWSYVKTCKAIVGERKETSDGMPVVRQSQFDRSAR